MKSEPMTVHNYVKNILYFEFGIFQTFTNYILKLITFRLIITFYVLCKSIFKSMLLLKNAHFHL